MGNTLCMCSFPVTPRLFMRADSYVAATTFRGPLIMSVITMVMIIGEMNSVKANDLKRILAVNSVKTGNVSSVENGRSPLVQCLVCGTPLLKCLRVGASSFMSMLVKAGRMLVLNTTIYVSMFMTVMVNYGIPCTWIRKH